MLVNVRSVMHLTSMSVPFLKKSPPANHPSITILTSNQGTSPDPESPLMCVSASMVQMLIKTVALETAYFGIRINGVATGVTKTAARTKEADIGMGLSSTENRKFLFEAQQDVPLLGQLNHPAEVANALLFLASAESSFTTGEILVIDGGQSLTTDKYDDYVRMLQRNAGTFNTYQ